MTVQSERRTTGEKEVRGTDRGQNTVCFELEHKQSLSYEYKTSPTPIICVI